MLVNWGSLVEVWTKNTCPEEHLQANKYFRSNHNSAMFFPRFPNEWQHENLSKSLCQGMEPASVPSLLIFCRNKTSINLPPAESPSLSNRRGSNYYFAILYFDCNNPTNLLCNTQALENPLVALTWKNYIGASAVTTKPSTASRWIFTSKRSIHWWWHPPRMKRWPRANQDKKIQVSSSKEKVLARFQCELCDYKTVIYWLLPHRTSLHYLAYSKKTFYEWNHTYDNFIFIFFLSFEESYWNDTWSSCCELNCCWPHSSYK